MLSIGATMIHRRPSHGAKPPSEIALRSRSHLVPAALGVALLGNAPMKAPPAPPLDAVSEVQTSAGAALLVPPIEGMALIPKGPFTMGATAESAVSAMQLCRREPLADLCGERPFVYELLPHTVHLDAFLIDRTEVTVGAYRRCVIAGECSSPAFSAGDPKFDRDALPVTHVSWEDATRFCAFRDARLPTEAEWERAARGLSGRAWPWGFLANPKLGNHGALDTGSIFVLTVPGQSAEIRLGVPDPSDGFVGLAPVASFPAAATPEGLQDLSGNVAEWVQDWWDDRFSALTVGNPHGPPTGQFRVVRGGSYRDPLSMTRATSRNRWPPSAREPTIGFRCAKDA